MLSCDYSQSTNALFKEGKFEVTNEVQFLEVAKKITAIRPFYAGVKRRSFVQAMLACFRKDDFNYDQFMNKLKFQRVKLVDCTTKKEYLGIIEEIYNFKNAHPIMLRYAK